MTRAAGATGAGARRVGRAVSRTVGRARRVAADDAHTVVAATTSAGRKLRPAPLLSGAPPRVDGDTSAHPVAQRRPDADPQPDATTGPTAPDRDAASSWPLGTDASNVDRESSNPLRVPGGGGSGTIGYGAHRNGGGNGRPVKRNGSRAAVPEPTDAGLAGRDGASVAAGEEHPTGVPTGSGSTGPATGRVAAAMATAAPADVTSASTPAGAVSTLDPLAPDATTTTADPGAREAPEVDTAPRPDRRDRAVTARRQRREGVVVPLRVPWTTRLRATAGLFVLVAFLGTATAMLIGGVALVVAQALGSV